MDNGRASDGSVAVDSIRRDSRKKRCLRIVKGNVFLIYLLLGIIIGVVMGIAIRERHPSFREDKRNIMYLEFPGKLLLRMLKVCIIPLIFSSLVAGMASLPTKAAGKLGGYTVLYYLITTFMAVLLGILLVATIKPGEKRLDEEVIREDKKKLVKPVDAILDLIRNAFPDNIIDSCVKQTKTVYTTDMFNTTHDNGSWTGEQEEEIVDFEVVKSPGTNVLGIVVFSVTLGLIIGAMGPRGNLLRLVIHQFQDAIISMVRLVIWYSPIGIAFLLAGKIVSMKDPEEAFYQLSWYMMCVIVGLVIHGFLILPLIYFFFVRANPFKLMYNMMQALLTALGTASSSATLPVTMNCLEENAKIDRRVSRFVLPVGATVNMDGTALYEAVASIFIAQVNDFDLSAGDYVTVSVTATAAAIGAAGVPEAGLVTMVIVLTALGLPSDDIGLILAIDWFLDRLRTSINVWGDSIGAGVVEKLAKDSLHKLDQFQPRDEKEGKDNPSYDYYVQEATMNTRI